MRRLRTRNDWVGDLWDFTLVAVLCFLMVFVPTLVISLLPY